MSEICYELNNSNNLLTIQTVNNLKLYFIYEIGKHSLYNIMSYLFNQFKYKCESYEKLEDFDFVYNGSQLDITNQPILNGELGENPIIKMTPKDPQYGQFDNQSFNSTKIISWLDNYEMIKSYEKPNMIQIFVKSLNGNTFTFKLIPNETYVWELKMKIQEVEKIPYEQQRLIHRGKQMEDNEVLSYLEKDDNIHLVCRLRGGMFKEVSGRDGEYKPLKSIFVDLRNIDFSNDL